MNWLEPPDPPEYPSCPVCGSTDYDYIYKDSDYKICGCSDCVSVIEAYDYWEEEYENAKDEYEE